MSVKETNVADFLKQLSLLVNSNLPLPEAVTQLGATLRSGDFRKTLISIGEETGRGRTLSDAMKEHSRYFTPMQIRMVEAGEKNGNLSKVLAEIADMAYTRMQLTQMVREIAIYPAAATLIAFAVLSFLMISIIPEFKNIFADMLEGEPLPWLTQLTIDVSTYFSTHVPLVVTALASLAALVCWLLAGNSDSNGLFNKIVERLPMAGTIFKYLALGKICAFLATLTRQETPLPEALEMIAELIENKSIRKSLLNIAEDCVAGLPTDEALEREGALFDMLRLTVKHAPEEILPGELANLAEVYRQKAAASIKRAEIFWEAALIMGISVLIGGLVITIFLPLITIVKRLGGG